MFSHDREGPGYLPASPMTGPNWPGFELSALGRRCLARPGALRRREEPVARRPHWGKLSSQRARGFPRGETCQGATFSFCLMSYWFRVGFQGGRPAKLVVPGRSNGSGTGPVSFGASEAGAPTDRGQVAGASSYHPPHLHRGCHVAENCQLERQCQRVIRF